MFFFAYFAPEGNNVKSTDMHNRLLLAMAAACCAQAAAAQAEDSVSAPPAIPESAFVFSEEQLGENENVDQGITVVGSASDVYASEVGYLFSPVRFRYRAFNQKYSAVHVNGAPFNDMETGQFRYSLVGGLNQQTRSMDTSLPFEANSFAMPDMAGANNYNFRPAAMAMGHRLTLSGANRSYAVRAMYTYNSGLTSKGWAFSANLTYRWADEGYVEGTFYNSLSYFLGLQKVWGGESQHSLSLSLWGNPTERASQGAATDESFWIANDTQYNPYWGYQNGKKRNSRVVNDFSPSGALTWDWTIDDDTKLTTTLGGKWGMYSSTKLNYNNTDNPQPDYWKVLPSSYYDVWGDNEQYRTKQALADWNTAFNWLTAKANRQVNWDRLYAANRGASQQGADAMYYVQRRHSDQAMLTLGSTMNMRMDKRSDWNLGFVLATSNTRHYQTMADLLGAARFHNINTYALGTYAAGADELQYDLNNPDAEVKAGDKFGYDYGIAVNKGYAWTSYRRDSGPWRLMMAARLGATSMERDGKMRNGLFANNSYGKSGHARFGEAGGKLGVTLNAGRGHTISVAGGYQWNAPTASVAFQAAEMNNDFVKNLKDEHVLSAEMAYQYQNAWLHANINGYYSRLDHVTEWNCFYFDDINSFSYVSSTGNTKEYYGVEAGLDFKLSAEWGLKLIGTVSDAKNVSNSNVRYLSSTKGTYDDDILLNEGMREAGTPLTVASAALSYHKGGWYIDLNGNYYDRIYLNYSPYYRYKGVLEKMGNVDGNGTPAAPAQAKGNGGFMLDGSIGKSIYLKHGSLSINLMVTNILNNQSIVTGGYEQSRSDYTASGNARSYRFSKNPKKYYAYGTNGMINIAYKF